jgi:hypothetical protein
MDYEATLTRLLSMVGTHLSVTIWILGQSPERTGEELLASFDGTLRQGRNVRRRSRVATHGEALLFTLGEGEPPAFFMIEQPAFVRGEWHGVPEEETELFGEDPEGGTLDVVMRGARISIEPYGATS